MVDAMLLPDTVPHDIVEIGRMAEDGSLPGPAANIEQVSGWLKDRNLKPIRHARKSTMTLPPMPPLSAGASKSGADLKVTTPVVALMLKRAASAPEIE
jgi:hypothetical protein